MSARDRREVLRRLISADALERLLARSFPSAKRFGVEGAETLIPGLQAVVDAAATHGVESIVMGVAHRGRLNILNNVFRKPVGAICAEMRSEGTSSFNVGDVRYHLGTRTVVRVPERPDEEALTAADTMDGGGGGDGGRQRRRRDGIVHGPEPLAPRGGQRRRDRDGPLETDATRRAQRRPLSNRAGRGHGPHHPRRRGVLRPRRQRRGDAGTFFFFFSPAHRSVSQNFTRSRSSVPFD